MRIRPARPGEHAALTALATRSKAVWGYDEAFMRRCAPELTITADSIAADDALVAEREGEKGGVVGFCVVRLEPPVARLTALFIDPPAMRTGVGRRLWQAAVECARLKGASTLEFDADPNAEGFYAAMGARRVGEAPSGSIPGRMLPLMEFRLA